MAEPTREEMIKHIIDIISSRVVPSTVVMDACIDAMRHGHGIIVCDKNFKFKCVKREKLIEIARKAFNDVADEYV